MGTYYGDYGHGFGRQPLLTVRDDGHVFIYSVFHDLSPIVADIANAEELMNKKKNSISMKLKLKDKYKRLYVDFNDWFGWAGTHGYEHTRYKLKYNIKDQNYQVGIRHFMHEMIGHIIPIYSYTRGKYQETQVSTEPNDE